MPNAEHFDGVNLESVDGVALKMRYIQIRAKQKDLYKIHVRFVSLPHFTASPRQSHSVLTKY